MEINVTTDASSISPNVEQPWNVQALFAVPVVPVYGQTRLDTIRETAASIDIEQLSSRTLGSLVRGLEERKGIAPILGEYPTLIRSTVGVHMPATWEAIASVCIGDVHAWPSVGKGKAVELIAFLTDWVGRPTKGVGSLDDIAASQTDDMVEALRTIAAWGASSGIKDLPTAIRLAERGGSDRPQAALQALYDVELGVLAGDRLKWWDAELGARDLLAQFDDRELAILESRVLHGAYRAQRTLEDLGIEFGVTRERVRQLEGRAKSKLDRFLGYDRYRSIHRAASRAWKKLGTACPESDAELVVQEDVDSLADELLLWVAGPYHRISGWVIDDEYPSVADLMHQSFDDVSEDNLAYQDDLFAAAIDRGLDPQYFDRAIADSPEIELLGHRYVVWPAATAGRARTMLAASGVPMTSDELFAKEPRVENIRSYRNALHSAADLVKVGVGRWGLVEWGSEEYPGTVPAMVQELQRCRFDGNRYVGGRAGAPLRGVRGIRKNPCLNAPCIH